MSEPSLSVVKNPRQEIMYFKLQLARTDNDTVVRCSKYGRTQYLKFENGLRNGWSICHGYTMSIIYLQADIDKVVGNIVRDVRKTE